VLRYPDETTELGATKNVQGAAVRTGGGRFLHIEMADPLRRKLLADADLRGRAFGALIGVLDAP
jgi:hypothetical protein